MPIVAAWGWSSASFSSPPATVTGPPGVWIVCESTSNEKSW
jgi:hypothetical protein